MLEIIFAALGVLFVLFLIFFGNKWAVSGLDKKIYENKWSDIEKTLEMGEAGLKVAVIDADKLLDHALIAKNFKGQTMGERMKSAGNALGNQNDVWSAHKLRNKLVHEQDVKVSKRQAKTSLAAFKKSLKSIGAL